MIDKSKTKPTYADLAILDEDTRIDIIGKTVTIQNQTAAFVIDDEPGKVERYIDKLLTKYPSIQIIDQFNGPVANTITVRVGPKTEPLGSNIPGVGPSHRHHGSPHGSSHRK